ncbi:MAG: hypothetical protein WC836_23520 [Desulfobacula sp.]|jgi:alcohol dehydrogenase YqhD (iron-dependent ADH family)
MDNFIYSIPTTAYFGKGQITILGETIKAHGSSKVLLAYGGGSIKKTASTAPSLSSSARPVSPMQS